MSSNDEKDVRFIEVSHISITDTQPKRRGGGGYRVVIKHEHGTEETIRSTGNRKEVTIKCKTFVQLNAKSTIHIHRSNQFDHDNDPSGSLNISKEEGTVYTVNLIGKPGMSVILKLGEKKTITQAAEARVKDAEEALKKGSKSAEELERVTGHVKTLVDVLDVAVSFDPFPFAEGAIKIAKLILEQMDRIPTEYKALKVVALDCINLVRLDNDARRVFTTGRVREQLSSVMALVLKALDFIVDYYSQSRISQFKVTAPSDSTINKVKDLTLELEKQKGQITNTFLLEIREVLEEHRGQERPLEHGGEEQRIPSRIRGNEGWIFVDNTTETDPLKRFLGTIAGVSEGKAPCLSRTRVSILEKLSTWAKDSSPGASRLFWLYGIAGCGKSAVAVSTSEKLVDANQLASSFFCKRDEVDRRNPVQLFSRLASFLAEKNPDFKEALVRSLMRYRDLDNRNKFAFVKYALIEPLSQSQDCAPSTPVIFLIDALDECNDSGTVAGFLAEIVAETTWIKFIVTSRELSEIQNVFVDSSIPWEKCDLFTDDPDAQSRDTHVYLREQLKKSTDLLRYVDDLARKADGLFIWLHTVTEAILSSKTGREKKIRDFLDQPLLGNDEGKMAVTYSSVLEQASGTSEMDREIVQMIAGMLLVTSSNTPLTIGGLYAFLPPSLAEKSSLNEFGELVMALKPVLKLTSGSDGPAEETTVSQYRFFVQTHHASFLDFCAKPKIICKTADGAEVTLSNPFFTDLIMLHRNMAMGCLEIMKKGKRPGEPNKAPLGLRFNICNLDTSHKLNSEVHDLHERISTQISPHLLYSSLYWASHISKSSLNGSAAADKTNLEEMLAEFFSSTRSLFWLEVLSLTENLTAGIEALVEIVKQSQNVIASEICRFVEQCFPAISTSTPHLYLSLTWLPVESPLWTAWKSELSNASVLKVPIQQPSELMSSTTFPVRVDTFAVSPDGKYIASGSRDGYVRLWDIRLLGDPVKDSQISPDAAPIGALAYTPDSSRILCAYDGCIYELDAEDLHPTGERIEVSDNNIRCMAVSKDRIAFGTENGQVVILDAKTYYEVSSEQSYEQTGAVDAICFSPDGSRLVYSSCGADVRILDVLSGSNRNVDIPLGKRYSFVTALAFSQDGKNVAFGNWSGEVRLFDAESFAEIGSFDIKAESLVQFLTFSYGTRIICAFASREMYVDHTGDLSPYSDSEASRHYIINEKHRWAEETSLQIWDMDTTRRRQTWAAGAADTRIASSVAFSPDGKKIVSRSDDSSVRVWDAQTGKPDKLAEMKHSRWVEFAIFSPDGKCIASGGDDKVIRIWDAQTGKPMRVLEGHTSYVLCGAFSPDGTRLVSGSDDETLRIWDIEPKNRPKWPRRILRAFKKPMPDREDSTRSAHKSPVRSATFSPDGSCIASTSDDSMIRLWDGKTGEPLGDPLHGHYNWVSSVAFSPDGTRLASGAYDTTVRIWDVRTRSIIGEPLQGHTSYIFSVVFSPDGAFIFSASGDGTIRCWNTVTGSPVGQPLVEDHHSVFIWSLAVSPDGHRIASSSIGGIRIWDFLSFEWEVDKSSIRCSLRGPDRIPDHIPEDGWVRTLEGGLLLWVPVEHRAAVCRLDVLSVSNEERDKSKCIMWNMLCHGEKWTDIRKGR